MTPVFACVRSRMQLPRAYRARTRESAHARPCLGAIAKTRGSYSTSMKLKLKPDTLCDGNHPASLEPRAWKPASPDLAPSSLATPTKPSASPSPLATPPLDYFSTKPGVHSASSTSTANRQVPRSQWIRRAGGNEEGTQGDRTPDSRPGGPRREGRASLEREPARAGRRLVR